jgi:hypothetical protein
MTRPLARWGTIGEQFVASCVRQAVHASRRFGDSAAVGVGEDRRWPTRYRGPLFIHAGLREDHLDWLAVVGRFRYLELRRSAIGSDDEADLISDPALCRRVRVQGNMNSVGTPNPALARPCPSRQESTSPCQGSFFNALLGWPRGAL